MFLFFLQNSVGNSDQFQEFQIKSVTIVVSFGELKVVTLFFLLQEVRLNMEVGIASLRESHALSKRAKQVKGINQNSKPFLELLCTLEVLDSII